jgi:aarF domain-containing kinase
VLLDDRACLGVITPPLPSLALRGPFVWLSLLWFPILTQLGQWAASRTDIFPDTLCEFLSKLHSSARPHSLAATKRTVSGAFQDRDFDDIFEEFIEEPLGVGAMAQVYKARLSKDLVKTIDKSPPRKGRIRSRLDQLHPHDIVPPSDWVVVKVLHPRVERIVERDLRIMKFFASVVNWIPTMEWLSLPGEVDQFALMMRLQLDLRVEAENLLVFRENFAARKDIMFPQPYIKFTSSQVLVEEFISGIPMSSLLKYSCKSKVDKEISDKGLDAFLKMLLIDNFIHSDLHPGNIYVRLYKRGSVNLLGTRDPVTSGEIEAATQHIKGLGTDKEVWRQELDRLYDAGYRPQVCFLDTGLVTELSLVNRRNFIDLFKAIAAFDGYQVGELMIERSRTPETAINGEIFALKVQRLVHHIKERTFALGSVHLGDLLSRMLSIVRQHHVRMEGDFVTVVLSILLLEGIGRQLNPDIDLFKSAIPILRQIPNPDVAKLDEHALSMIKVWLALEMRQFINASIQDVSEWTIG